VAAQLAASQEGLSCMSESVIIEMGLCVMIYMPSFIEYFQASCEERLHINAKIAKWYC
jgi:hypothetical protein